MEMNKKTILFVAYMLCISSYFFSNSCVSATFLTNAEVDDELEFTYERGSERGPEHWSTLNPQWEVCKTGKFQSPIDLTHERVNVIPEIDLFKRTYRPALAVLKNRGHDIMVSWKGDAGNITINGTEYNLLQCHWHSPSEHTINGTRFLMELHMVHVSSQGRIAVVGVLYGQGTPDPFLSRLLKGVKKVGEGEISMGVVDPRHIRYRTKKLYRYVGSLTVPPCTEGVLWTVDTRVNSVSPAQVKALRDAVHDGFETNARPVQHPHGRPLWYYDPNSEL